VYVAKTRGKTPKLRNGHKIYPLCLFTCIEGDGPKRKKKEDKKRTSAKWGGSGP